MKYRYLVAIVALITLLSIVVYAVGYEYTISTGDDFITAKAGDDLDEVAKKLNMTPHDLNTYFTQNGLIYLAVSADNKTQVRISAFSDNFSSKVVDIAYLDDVGLAEFIAAISEDADSPAQVIENNGRKYLCVKDTLSDSGGVYTVTQYITICNNKTFYFAGYNPGEDTSEQINAMFKSFNLQDMTLQTENNPKSKFDWKYLLIYGGIAFFGAAAIVSIIGIIKPLKEKEKEQQIDEI